MPSPTSRIAVDVSGSLLRVVDGALGGTVLRCGSGGTPANSLDRGRIVDAGGLGAALRQLLARVEIRETRAVVAVSDAVATFRVLRLPKSATDSDVDAAVSKELPADPQRLAVRWIDIDRTGDCRVVYAAAWDRGQVGLAADVARNAGLEPVAVELKSACVARAVMEPSCIVVDLGASPSDIILINDHVPEVWHSFELSAANGDDVVPALARPLRQILRFTAGRNKADFPSTAPVLLVGEQVMPTRVYSDLSEQLRRPVVPLPPAPRVPETMRSGTYLTCLGLLMRRG